MGSGQEYDLPAAGMAPENGEDDSMSKNREQASWLEDRGEIILLANRSGRNYMLDLPSGRCRLDAGRRIRTLRSILQVVQVKELVDKGDLVVEAA
jgi:hypothetical protein